MGTSLGESSSHMAGPLGLHLDLDGIRCCPSALILPKCHVSLQSGDLRPDFRQMSASKRRGLLFLARLLPRSPTRTTSEGCAPESWGGLDFLPATLGPLNQRSWLGAHGSDSAGRGVGLAYTALLLTLLLSLNWPTF